MWSRRARIACRHTPVLYIVFICVYNACVAVPIAGCALLDNQLYLCTIAATHGKLIVMHAFSICLCEIARCVHHKLLSDKAHFKSLCLAIVIAGFTGECHDCIAR